MNLEIPTEVELRHEAYRQLRRRFRVIDSSPELTRVYIEMCYRRMNPDRRPTFTIPGEHTNATRNASTQL